MKKQKYVKFFNEVKDIVSFILIFILSCFPLLKLYSPMYIFIEKNHYSILALSGLIGLFLLIINLYYFYKNSTNQKKFIYNILLPVGLLTIYMIWTLFAAMLAENRDLAINGTFYRKDGYISYMIYAGCFGLAFNICSKKIKKILLNIFSMVAILIIIIIETSVHGNFINMISSSDIGTATFYNTNHFGYYLLMAVSVTGFLFINEKNKIQKIIYCLMYIFLLYYFILNNTLGCYIALLTTFIIYFIIVCIKKERKLYIIYSICIFIILSCLVNNKSSNIIVNNITSLTNDTTNILQASENNSKWKKAGSGRLNLWILGVEFIAEKPILGYGPENLKTKYYEKGEDQDRPHNLLIQLATTSGIPGLLLYIGAIRLHFV